MSLIDAFEKDLINKLSFKASSKISSDALLFKTFKFFDLNNLGFVKRPQFERAVAKAGVIISFPQEMDEIFSYYDKQGDGKIYYQGFIDQVLFKDHKSSQVSGVPVKQPSSQELIENKLSQSQLSNSNQSNILGNNNVRESRQQQHTQPLDTPDNVAQFIKSKLKHSGIHSLLDLANKFKSLDTARTHYLSQQKINSVLNYLNKEHIAKLFQLFSLNPSGEVNYAELIYHLREKVSPLKTDLIQFAFERLDSKQQGEITIDLTLSRYEYQNNKPEFLEAVNLYCAFQGIDDGVFTDEDFCDFFGVIAFYFNDEEFRNYMNYAYPDQERKSVRSVARSRDFQQPRNNQQTSDVRSVTSSVHSQHFNNFMDEPHNTATFSKNQQSNTQLNNNINAQQNSDKIFGKKSATNNEGVFFDTKKSDKAESVVARSQFKTPQQVHPQGSSSRVSHISSNQIQMILQRISKRLSEKGPKGFLNFEKALRSTDLDQDSLVNIQEFKKVIKDQKVNITETECHMIFETYDTQNTGLLCYPPLIQSLKGVISPNRQKLINRVWDKVKESQDQTTFTRIKYSFKPSAHPDVRSSRRDEEELLRELQDTLLLVQDLNGIRQEEIAREDFLEYLENVSYSTADDQLFETTMVGVWKLGSEHRIEDQYAGSRKIYQQGMNHYTFDLHRAKALGVGVSETAPFDTSKEQTQYPVKYKRIDI